jgi:hypothetical protein
MTKEIISARNVDRRGSDLGVFSRRVIGPICEHGGSPHQKAQLPLSLAFRDRHVEAVERGGDKAVEPNQINQLVGAVLAEGLDRQTVQGLG